MGSVLLSLVLIQTGKLPVEILQWLLLSCLKMSLKSPPESAKEKIMYFSHRLILLYHRLDGNPHSVTLSFSVSA